MTFLSNNGQNGRTAMIAGNSSQRHAALVRLALLTGCSVAKMDEDQPADFLLVDLPPETEKLNDTLSRISHYLERHGSIAIIWTKMEVLEEASARLPQGQCHFLVDADDVEAMPILAGAF